MSTMFTALYPELVKTLILLAAPIDFSGRESLLHLWTDEKNFDIDALIDTYGNCPALVPPDLFPDDEAGPELLRKSTHVLR